MENARTLDREIVLTMVNGLDDECLVELERSLKEILRRKSQRELPQAVVDDNLRAVIDGLPMSYRDECTLWALFCDRYRPQRLNGKSTELTRLYRIVFKKFGRFLGRPAIIRDLNNEAVSTYLEHLTNDKKLSLHTVLKEGHMLLALWRFAVARNLGPASPEILLPDPEDPVPDAWYPEELQKLFKVIRDETDKEVAGIPWALWWEGLIRVVLDTGERSKAVRLMRWEFLKSDGWLEVPAGNRKGKRKGKRFRLRPETIDILNKSKPFNDSELLFPWPMDQSYFYVTLGKIHAKAGLPNNRRNKLHKMRRTCATYFESAGGDACKLLGHSTRQVTEKYLDERFIKNPQPVDLVPDPLQFQVPI